MATTSLFTRALPFRRQPGGATTGRHRQAAFDSPTFTVLGFRLINSATSPYQSRINEIRVRDLFAEIPDPMALEADNNSETSPPRKKAKIASEREPKCRICYTEIDGPYVKPCRFCKKPQCFDCIKNEWLAALSDHERMPVRCCSRIVYHNVAEGILPPAELAMYKSKYDESSTQNPFYCPVPTCSVFIPPRILEITRGKVTCYLCATDSCFKCRQIANEDHECPTSDTKAEILKSFNYKLCPKCGTGLMRMFGCAHVRCQCGAHWCWDCQRPINACYLKPCSSARDEGGDSEINDFDPQSVTDESSSVRDLETSHTVNEAELSSPGQVQDEPTVEASVNNIQNSTGSSERGPEQTDPTHPATVSTTGDSEAEASLEPTTTTRNESNDIKAADRPALTEVITKNLDDPDDPEYDWEAESYDFGEEPNDEYWDVWGCMHRYKEFKAEDIPNNWLANIDLGKTITLECMACFNPMTLEVKTSVGEPTSSKPSSCSKDKPAVDAETQVEAKTTRKDKRGLKKAGAFECRECAVIHCWFCRRAAVRKLTEYRKGAIV